MNHKVGDLVWDWAYQDFGVITKIWTQEELERLGLETDFTIEITFPEGNQMSWDRYKEETVDRFKRDLKEKYDES